MSQLGLKPLVPGLRTALCRTQGKTFPQAVPQMLSAVVPFSEVFLLLVIGVVCCLLLMTVH